MIIHCDVDLLVNMIYNKMRKGDVMNYRAILTLYLGGSTFYAVSYCTPNLNIFTRSLLAILIGLIIVAIQCKAERQAIEEYKAKDNQC